MRTQEEIQKRIIELKTFSKTANERLKKAIKEGDKDNETYWELAVAEFQAQIYGMGFALGMFE